MANAVTKDEVKAFVRDVRIEMDKRNSAKFALNVTVENVKSELGTLQDKVSQIENSNNGFSDTDRQLLARLAVEQYSGFNASDLSYIFAEE